MAKKTSDIKERTHKMKEKVLESLSESGNISYACRRAGISRETFYTWKEERPFALKADNAIDLGKSFVNDLAHTHLIQNIQQNNMQAVKFQLEKCHPDYQTKKERTPEGEEFVPITTINILPLPGQKTGEQI